MLARSKKSGSSSDHGPGTRRQRHPDHHEGLSLGAASGGHAAVRAKNPRKSVRIPRGSSTYIPPPLTSSSFSGAGATTGQAVQPYNPPKITTFGDRVNNAIQSYPLQKGIGNNPTDMQMYIRQNSN